jgi:hypothetical protein
LDCNAELIGNKYLSLRALAGVASSATIASATKKTFLRMVSPHDDFKRLWLGEFD